MLLCYRCVCSENCISFKFRENDDGKRNLAPVVSRPILNCIGSGLPMVFLAKWNLIAQRMLPWSTECKWELESGGMANVVQISISNKVISKSRSLLSVGHPIKAHPGPLISLHSAPSHIKLLHLPKDPLSEPFSRHRWHPQKPPEKCC